MTDEVWTEAKIELLRMLWAAGLATSEIGRRLGVTKSAAVGKAHRLKLERRPSPIRPGGGYLRPPQAKHDLLPRPPTTAASADLPPPSPPEPPVVFNRLPLDGACCWPIGALGTRQFRFCDAPVPRRTNYCEEHRVLAVVNAQPRRAEAA